MQEGGVFEYYIRDECDITTNIIIVECNKKFESC
jgi:hypothetical protein